ncbi:MAG: 3'-5' exonuclease [Bacteroidota bacterium]
MNNLRDILFLDIETVSSVDSFDALDDRMKAQWLRKADYINRTEGISDEYLYYQKAAVYAEFGKIVTIAIGYFNVNKETVEFRTKALYSHDEATILEEFKEVLLKLDPESLKLCAHNGREFDFPYISRRMLVNGIRLPSVLDLAGKKPWEVNHLDTMDMWKFGDWKHYTSLELLASIFGIDSSKTGMDGSQVGDMYYNQKAIKEIAEYCAQDVIVTAQLYLKLKSIDLGEIIFLDQTTY